MYIELLRRELTGAQLAIWEGTSGLPAEREQAIKRKWLAEAQAAQARLTAQNVPTKGCGCGGKKGNG